MLKKLLSLVVLATVLSLAFAQSTVEFATWGGTEDLEIYEALIEEFESENPDIIVDLIHIPSAGDYEQNLATLIAAGAAPDVFFINNISLPGFAAQGAFMPLEQFADEAFLEDFFPGHLDAFRYQGELMALPRDISNLVLFYNQDLFAEAGLEGRALGVGRIEGHPVDRNRRFSGVCGEGDGRQHLQRPGIIREGMAGDAAGLVRK